MADMMKVVEDILNEKPSERIEKWKKIGEDLLEKWGIKIPEPLTANNPKRVKKTEAISMRGTRLTYNQVSFS